MTVLLELRRPYTYGEDVVGLYRAFLAGRARKFTH
jgi:hypothetical protein